LTVDANLFHLIASLEAEVKVPEDGIVSRTLYQDDNVKAVAFGFAPGQELSEHTASMPGIMHFISGSADITVGTTPSQAGPGTWVAMKPNVPHSVLARENTIMLLLLIKCGKISSSGGSGAH
jgi:quercetin dioxygenase-like cupin family protein